MNPPNSKGLEVTSLFATPIVLFDLPDAGALSADLRAGIYDGGQSGGRQNLAEKVHGRS